MKTRRLTPTGDWTFGRNRADYLTRSSAIAQNLVTRLNSFANDWLLDLDANIDWIYLLSNRNTEKQIIAAIERVTLRTEGIATINKLSIEVDRKTRAALITLDVTDIFNEQFLSELDIDLTPALAAK